MTGAKPPRIRIAPSILASDFLHLAEEIQAAEAGAADRLHFDVMDGRFVPNISIGIPVLKSVRSATDMMIEAHLMIVEPERYVPLFAETGADLLIVHSEVSPHLYRTLQQIHDLGKRAGVAINPATPWTVVQEVLELADLIVVMTVNPGFGGQTFIEAMVPKVHALREEIDRRGLETDLEVDGGITVQTAAAVAAAGARLLVAGTSVFGSPNGPTEAIGDLQRAGELGIAGVPQ